MYQLQALRCCASEVISLVWIVQRSPHVQSLNVEADPAALTNCACFYQLHYTALDAALHTIKVTAAVLRVAALGASHSDC